MVSKLGRTMFAKKHPTVPIPQTQPLNKRQAPNHGGGFAFTIDCFSRLDRFLILGSDSPIYYQKAKALTKENAKCVEECFEKDLGKTIFQIVSISKSGCAPKNDAAIFALAIGSTHPIDDVRKASLNALNQVCRTATHLFQFVTFAKLCGRGWGRGMRRAVAEWYDTKDVDKLAYQMIKYRSRDGHTHKQIIRLAHPRGDGSGYTAYDYKKGDKTVHRTSGNKRKNQSPRTALYRWALGKPYNLEKAPELVLAHTKAMITNHPKTLVKLVATHRLPWEALPTECTKDPVIWATMLPFMGLTALLRNLGGMTSYGVFKPLSAETKLACSRLTNHEELRKARIHPFNILLAKTIYASGHSAKGSRSWEPVAQIVSALEDAFYASFKAMEPTGMRKFVSLDISGSMGSPMMDGHLTCREAAAAMMMASVRLEEQYLVTGFSHQLIPLPIEAKTSLTEVVKIISSLPFGATDCALPMIAAMKRDLEVDVFEIYTDNETNSNYSMHPMEALRQYRKASGIPAKLVVCAMTSTGFSIADPNDNGCLDVVGFDSAAPSVITDFCRGEKKGFVGDSEDVD